jgi:hypothetical protein
MKRAIGESASINVIESQFAHQIHDPLFVVAIGAIG